MRQLRALFCEVDRVSDGAVAARSDIVSFARRVSVEGDRSFPNVVDVGVQAIDECAVARRIDMTEARFAEALAAFDRFERRGAELLPEVLAQSRLRRAGPARVDRLPS